MRRKTFFIFAVFVATLTLGGCQNDFMNEYSDSEIVEADKSVGFFLKSAQVGEEASSYYVADESVGKYTFPDNVLFFVENDRALVVNQGLEVIDYNIFANQGEGVFRTVKLGEKPVYLGRINGIDHYAPYGESLFGKWLPFKPEDIGKQEAAGDGRFNGLLKAQDLVFAISGTEIRVYNLQTEKLYETTGAISGDTFSFQIENDTWSLTWLLKTPIGSLFELQTPIEKIIVYTLKA